MTGRVIVIDDLPAAEEELMAIGADRAGIELMAPKAVSRAIKIKGLRPPAANIIKQEMLSLGGEAATAYGSINHSVDKTDILLFGTFKQLRRLIEKLKLHQFGLPELSEKIGIYLDNYETIPKPIMIGRKNFAFGKQTYLMGILNITPDSFSDGGKFMGAEKALAEARKMIEDGADIIDIGGESSRPGSEPVPAAEEIKRVIPVIERLANETQIPISIDTTKALVARRALLAGASMINDISGLRFDPEMAGVAAEHKVPLCSMHLKGTPKTMQENPIYSDLMGEVLDYLEEGLAIAKKAGILTEKIVVDPGIGFGKTVDDNLTILKRLKELKILGRPILVGLSRKSMIGKVLDLPVEERLEGTAAAAAVAIRNGADIIRVHDVKALKRVAQMADAIVRKI